MPKLPSPASFTASWSTQIEEVAKGFRKAVISVYDLSSGAPVQLIASRAARVQHLRSPIEISEGGGWGTKGIFLFECELRRDDAPILDGMIVRVESVQPPGDPTLVHFVYEVTKSVNSSEAALRSIEAQSNMKIAPPVVLP